jgi:hypothetical protein
MLPWGSLTKSLHTATFVKHPIGDIRQPLTDYVSILKGTGYDGVQIKDVLQMSSGIRFNEEYGDFFSDINRMGRAIALNTSLDDFVASLKRERTPETYNHYVSIPVNDNYMLPYGGEL